MPCVIGESEGDCICRGSRRSVGSSFHRQGATYWKERLVIEGVTSNSLRRKNGPVTLCQIPPPTTVRLQNKFHHTFSTLSVEVECKFSYTPYGVQKWGTMCLHNPCGAAPGYDTTILCGIPTFTSRQPDITSPILTRWRRWRRNQHIHWMMTSDRLNSVSLAIRMLWSTWSNALAKSIKTARTDWPSSTALYQWCTMSTSAWVVERHFSAPYWWTSSLSLIMSSIHVPTNDSSSLLDVAVSEISRKSITWRGWTFGTGITLASFYQAGTLPSRTDTLKMEHNGHESWVQKSRRIQFKWLLHVDATHLSFHGMTNSLCTCLRSRKLFQNQISIKCFSPRLRWNYFRFRKTNGLHIGILFLVSILTYV